MPKRAFRAELRSRGQVTIPSPVREAARLAEGDFVEFELTEKGILLRPLKTVDATQAWFWEQDWQAGEREASADIAAGRTKQYRTSAEFLSSLKK